MENLDWLEWDCTPHSLDFEVTQHGSFPSCIERVELSRGSELKLLALGKGNGDFLQDERIKKLRPGEFVPDSEETIGNTEFGELVRLKGVSLRSSNSNLLEQKVFINAELYEAEVVNCEAPITTHLEWIVNFSLKPYIPSRATTREQYDIFTRKRSEQDKIERNMNRKENMTFDHFCCDCTVEGKKWSLIVGKVTKKVADPKCLPGFIEFLDINNCLPSENTKQIILAALSFTIGRQVVTAGSTSLAEGGDRVSYTVKKVCLLGEENAYKKVSMPPTPLDPTLKQSFVDENKVSSIINAVAAKMKDLNIEYPLLLLWLGQVSPLDVQAAHLGAAIESLRNSYCDLKTTLLPKKVWETAIKEPLLKAFDNATVNLDAVSQESAEVKILRRQLDNLNNKSSNMKYDEFFDLISLKIGEVEKKALRERNKPAHGSRYSSHQYHGLAMTTNALYTLFNRIVIKLTNAADCYIDYSTYGYPVRHIDHPLGGPDGDGCPAKT
ncbi:MAG TPA: hypothetical protein DDW76_27030 [Cyanobacteria bacterium UBA11369]|nr:hypothetical protein [Cyanobacteria bacterium UBA11371]HBE19930.1 hypothetical protein [Cyanobacteria bacterium UBA11367]HBE29943.1 hypothetical protein [Cyanobacteria bacterium UBA11368]HBE52324.1 hypothetical protein [Cyanobacteria bacterium UBA11369]